MRTEAEKERARRAERNRRIRIGKQPATRLCARCSRPAVSSSHHYCGPCGAAAEAERRRKSGINKKPTSRKYGAAHVQARKKWVPIVAPGGVACWRCGRLIPPGGFGPCPAVYEGQTCGKDHGGWDLGHDDFDRTITHGPEHRCCNRRTSTRQNPNRH